MIDKKFVGVESVSVSISAKDLDILCNTGKYSIEHEFEDYLELESMKEIKFIRKTFGDNAKLILAYIIGLCENYCENSSRTHTIPYGDLDLNVKVCNDGVVLMWTKEIK